MTAARLHVLVAREAPCAVVIRRGPSRYVSTFLWDLRTDAFQLGQWLRARVYERKCDLSPNGEHMIYFAYNDKWRSETRGSWTAISRAPYVKALTLYAAGGTRGGGGVFVDDNTYRLNDRFPIGYDLLFDRSGLACVGRGLPTARWGDASLVVYFTRLARDGWRMNLRLSYEHIQVFEKPWRERLMLRKYCHAGKGPRPGGSFTDSHALLSSDEEAAAFELWEWADVIGDRLVWAQAGVIYAVKASDDFNPRAPYASAEALHDFNGMKFQPIAAPY